MEIQFQKLLEIHLRLQQGSTCLATVALLLHFSRRWKGGVMMCHGFLPLCSAKPGWQRPGQLLSPPRPRPGELS